MVGRIENFSPNMIVVMDWIKYFWKPILRHCPRVVVLLNGWWIFHFLLVADCEVSSRSSWMIGRGSLVLSGWHVDFNPERDPINIRHLWMMLSGLPLQFLCKETLQDVANLAGKYIYLNESSLTSGDLRVAYVLVEVDLRSGLLAKIDILWKGETIRQKVDYLNTPFRYHLCKGM